MSFLSPNFVIGHISIGIVEDASCVNMGNNFPMDFQSHKKQNQGFGTIAGDGNTVDGVRTLLHDAAIMELLASQNEGDVPIWVQKIIQEKLRQDEVFNED